ncbi:ABC transporter ATP-binding protein [Halorubrum sp. SP3]|nr:MULTISPECIES: ABC transporter ATP-binding protein [unclassified Halorubrum]TKX55013.1 ABC transporter ATP-binding protein [Halorubrum sp. SP3]TKX68487.1 ABC transporter ATP-binding protein [Halorubrum sp. SP9]
MSSQPRPTQRAGPSVSTTVTEEPPLLAVDNLHTTFTTERGDVPAVDGVSFAINEGEVFGIVGESGSGKSVTALSLLGLADGATVTADRLCFRDEDLLTKDEAALREIRGNDISMIFQDPMSSLNPVMTVGEQIAEVVRHHGDVGESQSLFAELRRKYVTGTSESSASWQRAVELLDTVGIPDPADRANEYPHQLSGGMKQRVMIAQALAGDPDLIIADEPTTALDVTIEAQILNELLDLRDEFGVSIMLITHDLAVVRETCDRVAVMYAGEMMETADTRTLFEDPRHPYTRGLIDSIPRTDDDREWLDAIEGNVPDPTAKPQGCPFRTRCDAAFSLCEEPLVAYSAEEPGHRTWCHLYNDAVANDGDEVQRVDDAEAKQLIQEHEASDDLVTPQRPNFGGEYR